jgi:hypothetical protein
MNIEISENEGRMDGLHTSGDLTPEMINEIYQKASQMRSEAMHDGLVRAYRAIRRATTAIYRVLFTSEAHRHA